MSRYSSIDQLPPKLREQVQEKLAGREPKKNKYNAKPQEIGGIKFASKLEAAEYQKLALREKAGEISGLRAHVKFALFDPGEGCRGEHWFTYIADFVFRENGKLVVADAKSAATRARRDWPRTKKAMLACHNHDVVELGVKS